MEAIQLSALLQQGEGPTLEFKREMYRLDDMNGETKKRQRDEFIKDVLSLANGNPVFAGETAYLFIGVDDSVNEDGSRNLYDVGTVGFNRKQFLDIVNAACSPSIG